MLVVVTKRNKIGELTQLSHQRQIVAPSIEPISPTRAIFTLQIIRGDQASVVRIHTYSF